MRSEAQTSGVQRSRPRGWRRWLLWTLAALVVVAAALAGASLWMARRAEPVVRAALMEALQQRFGSRVELDGFHVSLGRAWLPGAWLSGAWLPGAWPNGSVDAEIDGLRIWLPEPQAAGRTRQTDPAQTGPAQAWFLQPWMDLDHLSFRVSTGFLRGRPLRIRNVQIDGVRLRIPPRGYRPRLLPRSTARRAALPLTALPRIVVEQITCSRVWLEMERAPGTSVAAPPMPSSAGASLVRPSKPRAGTPLAVAANPPASPSVAASPVIQAARQPLQFSIASLILRPDNGPIRFDLRMTNPRPSGQIHAVGVVGPWPPIASGAEFDPGALPLSGSYSFDHADLATLRGIAGRMDSTGSFRGILRQVEVSGQTITPDFRLTRHGSAAPVSVGLPLSTRFTATVDGTNGNTVLHSVEATLGRSHLWASGRILRVEYPRALPDQPAHTAIGHDIQLALRVDRGQIADLLQAATANPQTLIAGDATLDCALHLPPGTDPLLERLDVSGQIQASQVSFSNARIERKIAELSLRGQGHPEALRHGATEPVASTMTSHFTLADGVMALPDLDWQVPGARIRLHGTYTLEGGALDFSGDASTQAALSKMIGGWKGWLLKPMNRVLAKNGAGTDIPIRLDGTRAAPHFAIELNQLGKIQSSGSPDAPSSPAVPPPPQP